MARTIWKAPSVFALGILPPAPLMKWVQSMADDRYSGTYEDGDSQVGLAHDLFCAINRPVPRHTDDEAKRGMLVFGWIMRNDGHRLHIEGAPESLAIPTGCLYIIDPFTTHWTEGSGELIFSPHIMFPDPGRTPRKLLMDMRMEAIVAGINQEHGP